jgi:hypothetical protein
MITLCGRPSSRPARRPAHQTALRPALGGPQSRHSSHRSQSPHRTQALVVIMRHATPTVTRHATPTIEARNRRAPADTQRTLLSRGSSR